MRTAIKTLSIITIVIGSLALIGSVTNPTDSDSLSALVGGLLFLGYGICVLIYVGQNK
jgi:hypothetical protein